MTYTVFSKQHDELLHLEREFSELANATNHAFEIRTFVKFELMVSVL